MKNKIGMLKWCLFSLALIFGMEFIAFIKLSLELNTIESYYFCGMFFGLFITCGVISWVLSKIEKSENYELGNPPTSASGVPPLIK